MENELRASLSAERDRTERLQAEVNELRREAARLKSFKTAIIESVSNADGVSIAPSAGADHHLQQQRRSPARSSYNPNHSIHGHVDAVPTLRGSGAAEQVLQEINESLEMSRGARHSSSPQRPGSRSSATAPAASAYPRPASAGYPRAGVSGGAGGGGRFMDSPSPSPSHGSGSGAVDGPDGRDFFRQARARLSYDEFAGFLVCIKKLNSSLATREETLAAAKEIFGADKGDLYRQFESLLKRHNSNRR